VRLELRPQGVHVCLVEPGAIHTPAANETLGDPHAVVASLTTLPRIVPERALDRLRLGRLGMRTEFGCEPATGGEAAGA
jgi:hypothetical protein